MKAALISNRIGADLRNSQLRILELAESAVERGAKLLIFPETTATGLSDTGYAAHDLAVAETIPGPRNEEWQRFAEKHRVWFAAGLLERDGGRIHDSALLFDPLGDLVLHYRRIDPGWHRPYDDPGVYRVGEDLPVIDTPFGRTGFLICGDLWDDQIVARFKGLKPDILLYPFLRSVERDKDKREEWSRELRDYQKRWTMTGASVLAVNLYEGDSPEASIGGAWHVGKDGRILDSLPILKEGILLVVLPDLG